MDAQMKVSICIPQYNRIDYLVKSLLLIEEQTYPHIEVVVSDDCSTDNTVERITELAKNYKYPLVFDVNEKNMGYDRNYRKCIEMASGDYALVIGNDDSLYGSDSIQFLVDFLGDNNFPDVGYCNMMEERTGNTLVKRAWGNRIIGSGSDIALNNYSCFSFVGGLIYKRSVFLEHNTSRYDGSVFAQMYLGVFMVAKGATLFCIEKPLVIKDILVDGKFRASYRDKIARKWKDFRITNGGLPSVINVLICALRDADVLSQARIYHIFRKIYGVTFPHWILDYRENGALPAAWGMVRGLHPIRLKNFARLSLLNRVRIYGIYLFSTVWALLLPVFFYSSLKNKIYKWLKKGLNRA